MRILPAIVVFGAAGAGYVYHQEQAGQTAPLSNLLSSGATWVSSVIGEDSDENDEANSDATKPEVDSESAAAIPNSLDLTQIFRFDLTPDQVRQGSSRVKVGPPEGKLRAYRLPLVTGTAPQDISGSLAYFFEGTQTRRITFVGSSADPRPMIEFLRQQFGFQRVSSRNPGIETYSARTNCSGLLRITPTTQPDGRSQIDLSIAR